ncbi:MAG TPA: mechanosensitive ion channel family protein [Bacillota bacterium]|nr:mechanosensitive ion channel family protein [Bacillota bacterium]
MPWEVYFSQENLINLAIAIGIFLLFLLFRKIFTTYVFKILLKISRKSPAQLFEEIFLAFEKPFQWFFIIIGVYASVKYFPFLSQSNPLFLKLVRSALIVLVAWGLYNLTSPTSILFKRFNANSKVKIDDILVPFLSKGIRFIIIALSISVIAEEFDYDVNGFVAGLGLGGLAFALAAKDMIANLFGGVVIVTEKPFNIGDWILTPSVEGTVEDITFRSTKVRTFSQALVTVPNATLANESITNWSKMGKREVTFNLRLTYDTPAKRVKEVVDEIEDLLKSHPGVHQETIFVTFDQYIEDGLEIFLYFFTKTTDWGEYLRVREDINLRILEILDQKQISIAIPSRRLYTNKEVDRPILPLKQEP